MTILKYIWMFMFTLITLTSFSQSETGVRVFSGKCNMSQTGGDADEWFLSITNFNSVAGDASDISVGDFVYLNDGGIPYLLEITLISSASGSSASIRVSKEGVSGLSSVPTTAGAITSRTVNMGLFPYFANMSDPNNQLAQEYNMYLIDSLLALSNSSSNFYTTSVTPTVSNVLPSATWYPYARLDYLRNGSYGYYNGSTWVKKSLDNGFNVTDNLRITVSGGPLFIPNLNKGNRIYIKGGADGIFVDTPDSINQQNAGEIFVFTLFNNSADTITAQFDDLSFRNKAEGFADAEPLNDIRLGAFETVLIPFELVSVDGFSVLQTLADWKRNNIAGYYTPTITKNVSSDTTVQVLTHSYLVNGSMCYVHGTVIVNNAAGTLASSFRISFPPNVVSNFTNIDNDVMGNVTNAKYQTIPATVYRAGKYADTTNDRVTVTYDTDNNTGTRQEISYTLAFKIL